MFSCKVGLVVIVTILIFIQEADSKEISDSDICSDFLSYIKKHTKAKKDEETENDSGEDKKKPDKLKKFEDRLEKFFEKKFPWWPKQQVEDLDATEKPRAKSDDPVQGFLTSYMDFVSYLFKMF